MKKLSQILIVFTLFSVGASADEGASENTSSDFTPGYRLQIEEEKKKEIENRQALLEEHRAWLNQLDRQNKLDR